MRSIACSSAKYCSERNEVTDECTRDHRLCAARRHNRWSAAMSLCAGWCPPEDAVPVSGELPARGRSDCEGSESAVDVRRRVVHVGRESDLASTLPGVDAGGFQPA